MSQKKKINWWAILAIVLIGIPVGFVGMFFLKHSNDKKESVTDREASYLKLSDEEINFESNGDTKTIDISSNVDWSLLADDDAEWLSVSPKDGSNDRSLEITVDENTSSAEREAIVNVQWKDIDENEHKETLHVSQHGMTSFDEPVPPEHDPGREALSVSTSSVSFEAGGGNRSFSIVSDVAWEITGGDASWLRLDNTYGSNNKTITLTASENASSSSRRTIISVKWKENGTPHSTTVTVRQSGIATPAASFFRVSPTSISLQSNGGSKTVSVSSNTDWTISVQEGEWLTVSPTSGNRNKTITMRAERNGSTDSRSASVRFAWSDNDGETHSTVVSVTQAGTAPLPANVLSVNPANLSFTTKAESKTITVNSNTSWTVAMTGGEGWLTLNTTSGNRNKNITLRAQANKVSDSRTAKLTISWSDENGEARTTVVNVSQQGVNVISPSEAQSIVAVGKKSDLIPDGCVIVVNGRLTTNYLNFRNGVKLGSYSNVRVTKVDGDTSGVTKISVDAQVNTEDD